MVRPTWLPGRVSVTTETSVVVTGDRLYAAGGAVPEGPGDRPVRAAAAAAVCRRPAAAAAAQATGRAAADLADRPPSPGRYQGRWERRSWARARRWGCRWAGGRSWA